jgi:hypothetical protein
MQYENGEKDEHENVDCRNKQISRSYRSELPGEAFAEERRNEHKPYEGIRNKTYDYAHIRIVTATANSRETHFPSQGSNLRYAPLC